MNYFIIKILVFLLIFTLGILGIFFLADGNSDAFYVRFTTPKQNSLILGTSKAAQGLQPKIFNRILEREDFFNYSFTAGHSPYGPTYLSSIKKKINYTSTNGVYILTIDPYSISSRHINPNDSSNFIENDLALGDINFVNYGPNLEYLINHYSLQYIYILTKKLNFVNNDFLHADGWYEVNINMKDSLVKIRMKEQYDRYIEKQKTYTFSQVRLDYLIKTIKFLKEHGKVYLVRLPVSDEFLEIEHSIMPDFAEKIEYVVQETNVPYKHFNNNEVYLYSDGVHLYKDSGVKVSECIAKWIKDKSKL
jgi:hypothetical protein